MYTTVIGGLLDKYPGGVLGWRHGSDGRSVSGASNYGFALQLFMIEAGYHAGKEALYFLDSGNRVIFGIDANGKWLNG